MLQSIKYQYVTFLVLSTPPKLAKNAPTICFLIFRALLSGQTDKYRVMAKGVPHARGGSKRAEHATNRGRGESLRSSKPNINRRFVRSFAYFGAIALVRGNIIMLSQDNRRSEHKER